MLLGVAVALPTRCILLEYMDLGDLRRVLDVRRDDPSGLSEASKKLAALEVGVTTQADGALELARPVSCERRLLSNR